MNNHQSICLEIRDLAERLFLHLEANDLKHESSFRILLRIEHFVELLKKERSEEEYDITNDPRD